MSRRYVLGYVALAAAQCALILTAPVSLDSHRDSSGFDRDTDEYAKFLQTGTRKAQLDSALDKLYAALHRPNPGRQTAEYDTPANVPDTPSWLRLEDLSSSVPEFHATGSARSDGIASVPLGVGSVGSYEEDGAWPQVALQSADSSATTNDRDARYQFTEDMAISKRFTRPRYFRVSGCDHRRLTQANVMEFLRTGRICGRRIALVRFGLTG